MAGNRPSGQITLTPGLVSHGLGEPQSPLLAAAWQLEEQPMRAREAASLRRAEPHNSRPRSERRACSHDIDMHSGGAQATQGPVPGLPPERRRQ